VLSFAGGNLYIINTTGDQKVLGLT